MKLSLVIPCYNEAVNLPLLLPRCAALVEKRKGNAEVILVDNGSQDDTPAQLARLLPEFPGCRSIRVDMNQGYGFGILSGLREAKGDILAWTHADMQTDPVDALQGLELFESADDPVRVFVKGRRRDRAPADQFFTICMSAFETLLLRHPFWDINAQPTMLSRTFFETWKNPPNDFSFDLYAYYQARHAGLTVRRFSVVYGKRAHGVSTWNVDWKSKLRLIRRTVDFSLALRRGLAERGESKGNSA